VRSLTAIGSDSQVDEGADTDWLAGQLFIGMEPYEPIQPMHEGRP